MANTNLNLVGLDFEDLKNNFKTYLKRSNSPFKDVDYEGSNINYLLDVLSYNTYMNAFYLNMVASEMFLDTATLRDSVVSHAKELNYVPRSYRSAEAKISFNVTPSTTMSSLLIPKGTSFTTKIGSNNYTFSTDNAIVLSANGSGIFNANNLSIYEGYYVTDSFVFSTANTSQRFVISNPTVDTRSISVIVLENNGANVYNYSRATSFLGLTATSQSYFLQAAENNQYEILFGDNIIGRQPQNGSAIVVEYRVCHGQLPNGASTFYIDGAIQGQSNISLIITNTSARGGQVNESVEDIKFNAPRSYQNQERAITTSDYENILLANFPEIDAVSVFGGEEVDPPQYGKVFISADLNTGDGVPLLDQERFLNFIKPRCSLGIEPVFINSEFLYVDVVTEVRYNTNVTNQSPSSIETLVKNTIAQYNNEFLNNFKRTIRYSKLAEKINQTHPSILGIDLNIYPNKKIAPIPGVSFNAVIDFGFKLSKSISFASQAADYISAPVKALYSSRFNVGGTSAVIQDDRNGNVNLYGLSDTDTLVLIKKLGTIDYETGRITIVDLVISSFTGPAIDLHVNPEDKDFSATRNTIIKIEESKTEVTATPVQA